jgi:hypothetical protein
LPSIYIDSVYQTFIIGIAIGEIGYSCEIHKVCVEHVGVGDLVKFKIVVIEVDGEGEGASKAIKIRDGAESCNVGFLSHHFIYGRRKEALVNKCGQVLDLYKDSNNMTKKRKNRRLFIVTSFCLLDDIQDME